MDADARTRRDEQSTSGVKMSRNREEKRDSTGLSSLSLPISESPARMEHMRTMPHGSVRQHGRGRGRTPHPVKPIPSRSSSQILVIFRLGTDGDAEQNFEYDENENDGMADKHMMMMMMGRRRVGRTGDELR